MATLSDFQKALAEAQALLAKAVELQNRYDHVRRVQHGLAQLTPDEIVDITFRTERLILSPTSAALSVREERVKVEKEMQKIGLDITQDAASIQIVERVT